MDGRKTTLARSVGELPLDPQQRTGTDGSDPLNVCVGFRIPAHRDEAADTGAGVGKPPGKEPAREGR